MIILVTGGAGFIGSHLIQALHQAGHVIVNVDEMNDYYNPVFKIQNLELFSAYKNYTFYKTDICDRVSLEKIFETHQPDVVIHLGARAGVRPSVQNPALYKRVNYEGTKQLVDLAKQFGVKQFIFGSTSAVYGNITPPFSESITNLSPVSPYAVYKLQAEQYLSKKILPTTILRFFTVYGERGRPDMAPYLFTEAVLNHKPIHKFGDGTTSRDYTYIQDIISGIMAAINHPLDFEIINLGNHQAVSLNDFIKTLENITGQTAVIEPQPSQTGEMQHTLADISKARRLLDYSPTTSLQVGLTQFVNWYKTHRL
ncbi:MAG: NAD-dependent epimerase/dehydratase family protein [Patescibacteria group bacterium]